jgi:hypothetical protein
MMRCGEAKVPIEDVVGGFGRFKSLSAEKVAQIFQWWFKMWGVQQKQ